MALRKNRFSRPATHHQRGHVPPLPHPSWRYATAGAGESALPPVATARDFWDRLGI